MSLKKFAVLASILAFALPVVSAHAADAQTYVVGAGGTYRPFEFENAKKELVGFDIDIIKAISNASGFKIKLVSTPWEGIFATVNQGDRDILISGITITDKRSQMVDFSLPYFPADQVIIVGDGPKVTGLADLKKLQVGVVNSSTGDISVSDEIGKNNTAIHRFDNTPLMLEELYRGGVDAAVGDVGVIKFYIKSHPEKKFKVIGDAKFKRQYFGIAVQKGNKVMLDKINAGLKKIVADGTYAKIYKEWFDDSVPTLPLQ
ncbi:bacterial extracellular solute-binding s, 3 family protein [Collimonas arenae]|uniref:Bacterial extracellular solute-binding s, 3 family protein n=1 Tax=Collimonas arenae TaxID=279058 RepID=A0A127QIP6_9BURK|nr:basic amino acid ABC transporter substrate-binding protein [Collimonas arenae]AMP09941.1 bacterial extracellular solute-binding s, 3 family protein [Collimonas arenae]